MHGSSTVVLASCLAVGCASPSRTRYQVVSPPRDWTAHPAIVEIDPAPTIYAVSDVHGAYDRMVALLARHGVIQAIPATPDAVKWSGGNAVLVVIGDLMDKGPLSLDAIDALRALAADAPNTGGQVVMTLGNHEAEFLDDPFNGNATKDDGVDAELRARGIDPVAIASGGDPLGVWLRDRPFAVRVGRWFFAHAGNTKGRTVAQLEQAFHAAVTANDYHDPEIVGGDSILEARDWYASDSTTGARYARAVGAFHIVFGHDPGKLGLRGMIGIGQKSALFRIDCGMTPSVNDSQGVIMRVRTDGTSDVVESLEADGTVRPI